MKKLGKLRCSNLPKICIKDQRSIIGGSGADEWNFMLAPDGNWYCYPGGDAYVYGSAPGYLTDFSKIIDAQESWDNYASALRTGHYVTSGLGIITRSPIALGVALGFKVASDNTYDSASDLQQAIYSLEAQGYTDTSVFRYSHSNGVIQIWDPESGQLLYSSDSY